MHKTSIDTEPSEFNHTSATVETNVAPTTISGTNSKNDSKKKKKTKSKTVPCDEHAAEDTFEEYRGMLAKRVGLGFDDLRKIIDTTVAGASSKFPSEALSRPPSLTAERAIGKYGHTISKMQRPSSWDLSLDRPHSVVPGSLVLADCAISSLPECSLGIVVQSLEAHLVQVVFEPKSGGAVQCLIVPLEFLCIPGARHGY